MQQRPGWLYRNNEIVATMYCNAVISSVEDGVVDEGGAHEGC